MARIPTNGFSGKDFWCGTGRIRERSYSVLCALLWFNCVVDEASKCLLWDLGGTFARKMGISELEDY